MSRLLSSSEFQCIRSLRVKPITRQGPSYQVCTCQWVWWSAKKIVYPNTE